MALIAKGLVQAKPLALSAYSLISSVLSAPIPPSARDAFMKLLADMQGVRRLSNLLCPSFEDKQGYSFASGRLALLINISSTFGSFVMLAPVNRPLAHKGILCPHMNPLSESVSLLPYLLCRAVPRICNARW